MKIQGLDYTEKRNILTRSVATLLGKMDLNSGCLAGDLPLLLSPAVGPWSLINQHHSGLLSWGFGS